MKSDLTLSRNLVSDFPTLRASVIELLIVALVAAFGVNLASSFLVSWIQEWITLMLGILLISAAILYLVYVRFRSETRRIRIQGFVVVDTHKAELIEVPEYELASDAARYLAAAFKERPALQRQWESEPPTDDYRFDSAPGLGHKLMNELAEYLLLERVSTTLIDHFNTSRFKKNKLREYERNDLPQILLQNRFLELLSADMKDREGFDSTVDDVPSNGTVVMQFSNGHIYNRFTLTLPTDCSVNRDEDGSLLISSPVLELRLLARISPYGMVLPHSFEHLYLGKLFDSTEPCELTFELSIKLKRHKLMRREARNYAIWVEEVIKDLNTSFSSELFMEEINWRTIAAVARVFKES